MQVSPNIIRVIMGVAELNRILGTNLGVWIIQHCYSIIQAKSGIWYFKYRTANMRLVTDLPDSSKGEDNDFLKVSGN